MREQHEYENSPRKNSEAGLIIDIRASSYLYTNIYGLYNQRLYIHHTVYDLVRLYLREKNIQYMGRYCFYKVQSRQMIFC
jgi:hypothetical protein